MHSVLIFLTFGDCWWPHQTFATTFPNGTHQRASTILSTQDVEIYLTWPSWGEAFHRCTIWMVIVYYLVVKEVICQSACANVLLIASLFCILFKCISLCADSACQAADTACLLLCLLTDLSLWEFAAGHRTCKHNFTGFRFPNDVDSLIMKEKAY